MKRAFTLLELIVVIAVLAILMSLVFKLTAVGEDSEKQTITVARLQRLENCLSGYYAAFGNYPPVKLHGTRDIYQAVGNKGIQTDQRNESLFNWNNIGEANEQLAWAQVQAACKAQPVDCRFPFPEDYSELVDIVSEEIKMRLSSGEYDDMFNPDPTHRKDRLLAGFDDGTTRNVNRHSPNKGEIDWRNIQLFRFGLMSFLLPRYMVMMNGDDVFFREYMQWTGNNEMPSDPFTGESYALRGGWSNLRRDATSEFATDLARVANIPSQAVCARWIPNLANICQANHNFKLFGVEIKDPRAVSELRGDNFYIEIFSPSDAESGSTANQYILDGVTVHDGWGHEFYYYSPSPYQRYTLWSAGPNGRTFPPWIDRKSLPGNANRCISQWINDDFIRMSH